MSKIYTKIDNIYYPTSTPYIYAKHYHFALKVWAVTQAQYPNVPFVAELLQDDEHTIVLLFFTDNKSICDAISESYDKNFSIMCGMDQNSDCGKFQEGYE